MASERLPEADRAEMLDLSPRIVFMGDRARIAPLFAEIRGVKGSRIHEEFQAVIAACPDCAALIEAAGLT